MLFAYRFVLERKFNCPSFLALEQIKDDLIFCGNNINCSLILIMLKFRDDIKRQFLDFSFLSSYPIRISPDSPDIILFYPRYSPLQL